MGSTEKNALDKEQIKSLMLFLLNRNKEHIKEHEKWLQRIMNAGFQDTAVELKEVIALTGKANEHIEYALRRIDNRKEKKPEATVKKNITDTEPVETGFTEKPAPLEFRQIGMIRTPYTESAPYQPVKEDKGEFIILLNPLYAEGLHELNRFRYIYVFYYIHMLQGEVSMITSPPWTHGKTIGVFASRSPVRPNPIGLSIVRIKRIVDNKIYTSGLDAFDGTPLIDIKPYIKDLDSKDDADHGWIEDLNGYEHMLLHIKGIPHDY